MSNKDSAFANKTFYCLSIVQILSRNRLIYTLYLPFTGMRKFRLRISIFWQILLIKEQSKHAFKQITQKKINVKLKLQDG